MSSNVFSLRGEAQALAAAGRWPGLLDLALRLQGLQPQEPIFLYWGGLAYAGLGQFGPALAWLNACLRVRPQHADALWARAQIGVECQRWGLAAADLRCLLASRPSHVEAWQALAQVSGRLNDWPGVSGALACLALLCPERAGLALSQAVAFLNQREMGRAGPFFERALVEAQAVVRSQAVAAEAVASSRGRSGRSGRGPLLQKRAMAGQSAANAANAVDSAEWEYAMQLLLLEDFERGWRFHEARLRVFGDRVLHILPDGVLPMPRWQGEPLAGKHLLVHGEQGTGDEVMFASVLPELVAQAGHVTVACHPNLVQLFAYSFPTATVVAHSRGNPGAWAQALPGWLAALLADPLRRPDFQVSSSSLARFTRPDAASFPGVPFLRTAPARQARMAGVLQGLLSAQGGAVPAVDAAVDTAARAAPRGTGLRIGLAWAGNLDNPTAALRSLPLEALLPLREALPGAVLVSLQSAQYAAQALAVPAMRLVDCSAATEDFADLAALMQGLDLVITVDTSYVHIAGATGCPTWLLQSRRGEWRWGWLRESPLWYRCVRLFWQERSGDWSEPVAAMALALRAL